ncbi:MAG: acetolactate synthase small subunit [Alphaproteobacteria bacterium]|nr:acetolactate synthase small subunit [Alphaproteobacteria bacterium]MDA8004144.1 acetolactate synthase small subunit [Alphaproteobacteria bacterium]MDA8006181.1 acetolactate synthase small subunit [Alphaproteobacteria bacterium]MDA8012879.1 acetolactate synthase small subunit [Alphaproteobacteria bacterium]
MAKAKTKTKTRTKTPKRRARSREPGVVYDVPATREEHSRHCIAVLVKNEPGVLARVVGLFSGRGYNIESLTVSEVHTSRRLSRINIVTSGSMQTLNQIIAQLSRLVPVVSVSDLTLEGPIVERELALLYVQGRDGRRLESLRIADMFRARVVDSSHGHLIFEVSGNSEKVDAFIRLMEPLGLAEISRTGVVALNRGGGDKKNRKE